MLRNRSALLGALIVAVILMGVWITTRADRESEATSHISDETLHRDADGLVTTVDVQGEDVVFTAVGEFTDAIVQLSGPWTVRQAPKAYNGVCAWAGASQPTGVDSRGADLSFAYIRPSLPVAGRYDVYGWWCDLNVGNLDENSEIRVHAKAGEVYQWTIVDQRATIGEWHELGTFYIEPDGEVTVSNWDGAVVLDALRFVYQDDLRDAATPPISMPPPPLASPTPVAEK